MKTVVHVVSWVWIDGVSRYCESVGRVLKGEFQNIVYASTDRTDSQYLKIYNSVFDRVIMKRPSARDIMSHNPVACIWHLGVADKIGFCTLPNQVRSVVFLHGAPPKRGGLCRFDCSKNYGENLHLVFPSQKRMSDHYRGKYPGSVVYSASDVSAAARVRIGNHNSGDSRKFNARFPAFVKRMICEYPNIEFHFLGMHRSARTQVQGVERVAVYPTGLLDPYVFLSMLDVFFTWVVDGTEEGFSCSISEAMSSGLPIVADNKGGTPELISNGVNGLLCNTESEFWNALAQLISDPLLRMSMSRENILVAERKLSLDSEFKTSIRLLVEGV